MVEGTGLGLAICKRLTGLMGGELKVASAPGAGSRFWFDLDLPAVPLPPTAAQRSTVIGVAGERVRVLIADDEDRGRGLLRDLLTPLGFAVHESADGEEAVRDALRLRPDAILMDIRMPRLDGIEASRRIRALPELERTVIIAISASAFESDRQHCIDAGVHHFLPKPFRQEKLLGLLCEQLQLTPVYASDEVCAHDAPLATLTVPPVGRLRALLDLAARGDIKNLQRQMTQLETLDAAYSPFVAQLRLRTAAYQMKELRRWLRTLEVTAHESPAR
jgi:CheY-like chemotaxis protein